MKPADKLDLKYVLPTPIIDSDHSDIREHALSLVKDIGEDPIAKAVKLYYAVRDGIWYNPYSPFYLPEHYRASCVLQSGRGYCVSKASLLCALARACGIPARLGFATVRSHLATKQLLEHLGCDLFVYHGYTEMVLEDRWVIATPAFNRELCQRHKVAPLEFNGREDSIFQPYNMDKKKFMEYVAYHGSYADIPVDLIVAAWQDTYGNERVQGWIDAFEQSGGIVSRDFSSEDVINA